MIYKLLKLPPLFLGLILLSSCAVSGVPAQGRIGEQSIDTRVDSEVARYYLANYLAGRRGDALLDQRIDALYKQAQNGLPTRDELKSLSDDFSVDFAALYLADQITRSPINQRFRSAYDQAYSYTRKAFSDGRVRLPGTAPDYEVLFVPTYLYKRVIFTGANMATPRAALEKVGFPCFFVETADDGPIEANAELVMAAIRGRAQSGHRLIIISASKSGAEVALALSRLGPAETRHVAAWVNAVGALQGTPLVDDRVLPDVEFLLGKIDAAGADSMTTARSRERFKSIHVPAHVLVVNYFGIPVTGSVSFFARRGFLPLLKYGPNDGIMLLADMILPGGVTLIELGSDHFMFNHSLDITAVAMASTVIRWLENEGPPNDPRTLVRSPATE